MIYVVVRATTDWRDEAAFRAQIPRGFAPAIARWEATFDMPYRHFRYELARIAQASLACVAGVARVTPAEVPEGALVLPTDDDDWFAPHVAQALAAHAAAGVRGYFWPSRFLEVPMSVAHRGALAWRRIFPRTKPRWLCTTNNYAVVADAETRPLLRTHVGASRWFVAHPAAVRRIDAPLSLQNRNLASQTTLNSVRSPAALRRRLRRYQALYRQPLPAELDWAAPYVGQMRDLLDALRPRAGAHSALVRGAREG